MLSMPIASLETYVHSMIDINPLLEADYTESYLEFEELPEDDADKSPQPEEASERTYERYDMSFDGRKAFDFDRLNNDCSETETLQSHLRVQLREFSYSKSQYEAVLTLIDEIDKDGYFAGNLYALCSERHIDKEEAERLLADIQTLSPRGVGARNLAECLMLQLSDGDPYKEIIGKIFGQGMEDFAQNRSTRLQKEFGLSHQDLIAIKETIRVLDPRPGSAFSQQNHTTYVIPDIAIAQRGNGFAVEVTGEISQTTVLNKEYMDMLENKKGPAEALEWLASKSEEAQSVLRNISQRKQTLYRFGLFLIESQYEFFRFGEARVKPLTMQQAADVLGIHVSTISRTVQDKHVLTPWGTYPLKFFFCSSIGCVKSERKSAMSSLAIKSRIKDIVAAENKQKPLSDAALTALLNDEGIDIKRRTVAKYREALGIGTQSQRRW